MTIKAEQVPGNVNSVRFSPEGLQFSKPATVELSYRNCSLLLGVLKRVAYTDEKLRILELIPSLDLSNSGRGIPVGYRRSRAPERPTDPSRGVAPALGAASSPRGA